MRIAAVHRVTRKETGETNPSGSLSKSLPTLCRSQSPIYPDGDGLARQRQRAVCLSPQCDASCLTGNTLPTNASDATRKASISSSCGERAALLVRK